MSVAFIPTMGIPVSDILDNNGSFEGRPR